MDLNDKMAAAAWSGGVLRGLTTEDVCVLVARGHAKRVETTGRWVLTDAGWAAADELAAVEGVG